MISPMQEINELPSIPEDLEIEFSEIKELKEIGRGSFGVVCRGVWRSKNVAVKKINTSAEQKALMTELKQLSRVNHPNIIQLYGASTKQPICLIMELAETSLFDVLHYKHQITFTFHHALNWAFQCAKGVEYLHSMKPRAIIHRDLKPPNLLLLMDGKVLKICDFGTACDIRTQMTNSQGSAAWMAPEVFEGMQYSEKCDIFSWSIILWELLTREKPFNHITDSALAIMWAVHTGKRPPLIRGCPVPLENLMTSCWDQNPNRRPSMKQVVEHLSRMFRFFPEEVPPLQYPSQADAPVEVEGATANDESLDYSSYWSNLDDTSNCQPSSVRLAEGDASKTLLTENVIPSLKPVQQPAQSSLSPSSPSYTLPGPGTYTGQRTMHSETKPSVSEPLHLLIGGEDSSSAEGYAIRRLEDDFLTGGQCYELPISAVQPPAPIHSNSSSTYQWTGAVPRRPPVGHHRSASQGSTQQIHVSMPSQQSMPCLSNVPSERSLPRSRPVGGTSNFTTSSDEKLDEILSQLDPSLHPIPPCPTSQVSMRVYEDHKKMAEEFVKVQNELKWLKKYHDELNEHLKSTKNEENPLTIDVTRSQNQEQVDPNYSHEEFERLKLEKENLMKLHRNLTEQLASVKTQQQQQQQQQQPSGTSRSPPLPDDGWVVLSRAFQPESVTYSSDDH